MQEQELSRSLEMAEVFTVGSDDRGSVTERLREWACAWAATLGVRVWELGDSSKLVLYGVRMMHSLSSVPAQVVVPCTQWLRPAVHFSTTIHCRLDMRLT